MLIASKKMILLSEPGKSNNTMCGTVEQLHSMYIYRIELSIKKMYIAFRIHIRSSFPSCLVGKEINQIKFFFF
jgi:hypothetical protein